MNIDELKPLEKNPFKPGSDTIDRLAKSIEDFQKMLSIRKIVIDENNTILGGNKKYFALKQLGYKQIPDEWIDQKTNLTPEEKERFIVTDNAHFGSLWDYELLEEWNKERLEEWGLDIPVSVEDLPENELSDNDFEKELSKITDGNCKLPIVPVFFEEHECFIIPCHNEIDVNFIRDLFSLNGNYVADSGDKKIRKTNVINVNDLKEWIAK